MNHCCNNGLTSFARISLRGRRTKLDYCLIIRYAAINYNQSVKSYKEYGYVDDAMSSRDQTKEEADLVMSERDGALRDINILQDFSVFCVFKFGFRLHLIMNGSFHYLS